MKIIIANNYRQIEEFRSKFNKHKQIILSAFLYMNYLDAVAWTYKTINERYDEDVFIIDPTGLTIKILLLLKNISYRTGNHMKGDRLATCPVLYCEEENSSPKYFRLEDLTGVFVNISLESNLYKSYYMI